MRRCWRALTRARFGTLFRAYLRQSWHNWPNASGGQVKAAFPQINQRRCSGECVPANILPERFFAGQDQAAEDLAGSRLSQQTGQQYRVKSIWWAQARAIGLLDLPALRT